MEQNNFKTQQHTCQNELRFKKLERWNKTSDILHIILTPKMVLALSISFSIIIQAIKGV